MANETVIHLESCNEQLNRSPHGLQMSVIIPLLLFCISPTVTQNRITFISTHKINKKLMYSKMIHNTNNIRKHCFLLNVEKCDCSNCCLFIVCL